jgi:DNA-binding NarL/FixJ family response regulator
MTTILLADDHPIVRRGVRDVLARLPGASLVGESADGLETIRLAEKLRPDILLLDLRMPGLNGWEVAREVQRRALPTRIIILSMYANDAYVVKALRAGAQAYVLKESAVEELVEAIQAVLAGKRYFSKAISEENLHLYQLQEESKAPDPYHTLTPRERQVLQLTTEGLSSHEVADRLFISSRTVETHRANLMRKLGVRNLKELVRVAVEQGMVPRSPEFELNVDLQKNT